jgi:hypothetical protein
MPAVAAVITAVVAAAAMMMAAVVTEAEAKGYGRADVSGIRVGGICVGGIVGIVGCIRGRIDAASEACR